MEQGRWAIYFVAGANGSGVMTGLSFSVLTFNLEVSSAGR